MPMIPPVHKAKRPPQDWRTLRVRQWEPSRYWVQSQTRELDHLVDTDPWGCSCEYGTDFSKDGENRDCAHQRRLRLWLKIRGRYA